ncbi:uncharacterized protein LOC117306700 [Asterias rubens]|uniref:uncharacterized protein LOC117306700 n=1 Tax=Asterias rubens TaxID=7604 RepID=UPI001455AA4C|nr:uncharacterized protein LOC117306700 [Asterias rubens]
MARTVVAKPTNCSIKCMVFFLFLSFVSSQNCTDPLLSKCTCTEKVFLCISANLTEFPTDVPHKDTIIHIRVTNNSIPVIDMDILSGFTQLQTISLEDNGLTRIANQSLPSNLSIVILNNNPIICDDRLLWLTNVPQVVGSCDSEVQIATFLETLKPTPTAIDVNTSQQAPVVTDIVTEPMTFTTVGTTLAPATNKLYVLAIIIPIIVLVVICTVIVIFSIRKTHQQKEAYNSSIRYSVVRKDAGAGNRVYSDVTTEL